MGVYVAWPTLLWWMGQDHCACTCEVDRWLTVRSVDQLPVTVASFRGSASIFLRMAV